MSGIRLYIKLTGMTIVKYCQQILLLAALGILWSALPVLAGLGAEQTLAEGVSFSGITLAVTAPEGDRIPELLETYLGKMTDVREYCTVRAMAYEEAVSALRREEITAIVVLPEAFVQGVQWGENPDVRLVVNGARQLESILTLWVGQSACDLLSAVQSGIYAVSDVYDAVGSEEISRSKMLSDINMKYILWTLDRQSVFEEEKILPTGILPIKEHYALSLLGFFTLSLSALFSWNYQGSWLMGQKRLRIARRSSLYGYFAGVTGSMVVLTAVTFAGIAVSVSASLHTALGISVLWALFAAFFSAVCALVTRDAASCGGVSFVVALCALVAGGGVIPPVLLPEGVRMLEYLSPVAWMRDTAAWMLGYETGSAAVAVILGAVLTLGAVGALLYDRRIRMEVCGR